VLTQLVQEKVLAKKYKVSDKEIDNKLKEYKTQLGDQYSALKQQYGEDYLKDQVKYELLAQKAGCGSRGFYLLSRRNILSYRSQSL
jgi:foldase protein PrsA